MRVFDFDNTIYDGESVIDFYLFSLRRNPKVARYVPVVLYHLLRYKLGRTTMADLEQAGRKHAAQYLSSFDDPEGLVRDFWDGHMRKIKAWYHPEKVMELTSLLVSGREYDRAGRTLDQQISHLKSVYGAHIQVLHNPEMNVASARIRDMAARGEDIGELVPGAVAAYIREHRLYQESR